MIQYIYFVRCPGCEDEHFDFFDEAKEFALSCISKKPIITQIEVNRNDFGECVDSADLGTVWSWEEVMSDIPDETELQLSKSDTTTCEDFDSEFNEYSDKDITFETDCIIHDHDETLKDSSDNFRKPIPAGMTIEALVEEMEENEDEVECGWCEELFNKDECYYDTNLGWLCGQCVAAIKSRGEELTITNSPLTESVGLDDAVDLVYDKLTITLQGPKKDVDDWEEVEYTSSYTLTKDKYDVAVVLWEEEMLTDEDVAVVPGGFEALEDDQVWETFVDEHFDVIFENHYTELLDYYKEEAIESFQDSYTWEDYMYDRDMEQADKYDPFIYEDIDHKKSTSMLEELEDAESYSKRSTPCPECGENSFDVETGFCIKCGFNV